MIENWYRKGKRRGDSNNSRLTQKHHLQPAFSANAPPITGPIVDANDHTDPTSPSIKPLLLSENRSETMIFTRTDRPPAPSP